MKFMTQVSAVLVALCIAAVVNGRPTSEDGGRQRRSSGGCQPKKNSKNLQQRALCPFTTTSSKVFVGQDVEVEKAELDPECANSDLSCGEGGRGLCSAVWTKITYGSLTESVTLAFVCADEDGAVEAHKTDELSGR